MEQMEAVLGRLSEIESAAVALEEKAAEQKKQWFQFIAYKKPENRSVRFGTVHLR